MSEIAAAPKKIVEIALAIVERDGKFLLQRRAGNDDFAGTWEFPGGKIEPGESSASAAMREAREELGLAVNASRELLTHDHDYDDFTVRLHCVLCSLSGDILEQTRDRDVIWVALDGMRSLPLPPANYKLIELLETELRNPI